MPEIGKHYVMRHLSRGTCEVRVDDVYAAEEGGSWINATLLTGPLHGTTVKVLGSFATFKEIQPRQRMHSVPANVAARRAQREGEPTFEPRPFDSHFGDSSDLE